jgi:hypothetical protein
MGTACSGVGGHLRGWHIGIRVLVCPDPETGADKVQVWRTSGSEGRMGADTLIYEETLPTHINQS